MGFKLLEKNTHDINTLFEFIYKDYSSPLKYMREQFDLLYKKMSKENTDINISDIREIKEFTNFFISITMNNSYLTYEEFEKDDFFLVWLYEFSNLFNNLNHPISYYINNIEFIMNKLEDLQNLFYEAINICLNESHRAFKNYSSIIDDRIYYYSISYSNSVFSSFNNTATFSEYYISEEDITELNKNLFTNKPIITDEISNLHEFAPSETQIFKDYIRFPDDKYELSWYKNYKNGKLYDAFLIDKEKYKIPSLKYITNRKIKWNKILDFNTLESMCLFYFNRIIEQKEKYSVLECKLCGCMFIKTKNSRKKYCDNTFFDKNNKPCSCNNVGNKYISKQKNNQNKTKNLYDTLYDRIQHRPYDKDKKLLDDLSKLKNLWIKKSLVSSDFFTALEDIEKVKPNSYIRESILQPSIVELLEKENII